MKSRWGAALVLALCCSPWSAWAQITGGRVGGSRFGSATAAPREARGGGAPSWGGGSTGGGTSPAPIALPRAPEAPRYAPLPSSRGAGIAREPPAPRGPARIFPGGVVARQSRPFDPALAAYVEQPWALGPPQWREGFGWFVGIFGFTAATTLFADRLRRRDGAGDLPAPGEAPEGYAVQRVTVVFDASARVTVQQWLRDRGSANDNSPRGLHDLARHTRDLLRESLGAARYAFVEGSEHADTARVEAEYRRVTDDLRGRYVLETVENARRVDPSGLHAKAEEGEGLVVVTLVLAHAGRATVTTAHTRSVETLAAALADMVPQVPEALLAVDVIWSPERDEDRLSSAELEVCYPELRPLPGAGGFGRAVCAHCDTVYARELLRCPHCGAPR
jgi:uncharacterized membrane protein